MTDWQPIETAPKDGSPVDLWVNGFRAVNCYWLVAPEQLQGGWYSHENDHGAGGWFEQDEQPTHWMPLPAPPKDKD